MSQKRERVFFIGVKDDIFFEQKIRDLIEEQKNPAPNIRKLLYPLGRAGTEENPATCTARITFATHPVMRKSPYAGMYFNGQGRPIDVDGYANTLPASMGGNKTPFIDEEYLYGNADSDWVVTYHKGLMDGTIIPEFKEAPERLRRITIKEAAKIQTFPGYFKPPLEVVVVSMLDNLLSFVLVHKIFYPRCQPSIRIIGGIKISIWHGDSFTCKSKVSDLTTVYINNALVD